jgi:hypothetical protein
MELLSQIAIACIDASPSQRYVRYIWESWK